MSIISVVESLRDKLISTNTIDKIEGFNKLLQYLENKIDNINKATCEYLLKFYTAFISNADENNDLAIAILKSCQIIISHSIADTKLLQFDLAEEIVKIQMNQMKLPVRRAIIDILYNIFLTNKSIDNVNDGFIRLYFDLIQNETHPEILMKIWKISIVITQNIKSNSIAEEYFQSLVAYFPLDFVNSSKFTVTHDQLMEILSNALLAHLEFYSYNFLITLLTNLKSDQLSYVEQSLDLTLASLKMISIKDIIAYYLSFIDVLLHMYKEKNKKKLQSKVIQVVLSFIEIINLKFEDKEVLELSMSLYQNLGGHNIDQDRRDLEFLVLMISNSDRLSIALLARFMPSLIDNLTQNDFKKPESLEALTEILLAATKHDINLLTKNKGLIDNNRSQQFFIDLGIHFDQLLLDITDGDITKVTQSDIHRLGRLFQLKFLWLLFNIQEDTQQNQLNQTHLIDQIYQLVNHLGNIYHTEQLCASIETVVPLMFHINESLVPWLLQYKLFHSNHIKSSIYRLFDNGCPSNQLDILCDCIVNDAATSSDALRCMLQLTKLQVKPLDNAIAKIVSKAGYDDTNQYLITQILTGYSYGRNDDNHGDHVVDLYELLINEISMTTDPVIMGCYGQWFCAVLSWQPASIDNLNVLCMLIVNHYSMDTDNSIQANKVLCDSYASIINRLSTDQGRVTSDLVMDHLTSLKPTFFILSLRLIRAILNNTSIESMDCVVEYILKSISQIDQINVTDLCSNINALFATDVTFCDQKVLYPSQSIFYAQKIFTLMNEALPKNNLQTMEIMLHLVESIPLTTIDEIFEFIQAPIIDWLTQLHTNMKIYSYSSWTSEVNASLLLAGGKVCCRLPLDIFDNQYHGMIIQLVYLVLIYFQNQKNLINNLSIKDRVFVCECIQWFYSNNRDTTTNDVTMDIISSCDNTIFNSLLKQLISDKKSIVKMTAAKSRLVAFLA